MLIGSTHKAPAARLSQTTPRAGPPKIRAKTQKAPKAAFFEPKNMAVLRLWDTDPQIGLQREFCPYNRQPNEDLNIPELFGDTERTQCKNGMLLEIGGHVYLAFTRYMRSNHALIHDSIARHLAREQSLELIPDASIYKQIRMLWAGELKLLFGANTLTVLAANETSSHYSNRFPDLSPGEAVAKLAHKLKQAQETLPWLKVGTSAQWKPYDRQQENLEERLNQFRTERNEGTHGVRSNIIVHSTPFITALEGEYTQKELKRITDAMVGQIEYLIVLLNVWASNGLITIEEESKFEAVLIEYMFNHTLEPDAFEFFLAFINKISEMLDNLITPHVVDVFKLS